MAIRSDLCLCIRNQFQWLELRHQSTSIGWIVFTRSTEWNHQHSLQSLLSKLDRSRWHQRLFTLQYSFTSLPEESRRIDRCLSSSLVSRSSQENTDRFLIRLYLRSSTITRRSTDLHPPTDGLHSRHTWFNCRIQSPLDLCLRWSECDHWSDRCSATTVTRSTTEQSFDSFASHRKSESSGTSDLFSFSTTQSDQQSSDRSSSIKWFHLHHDLCSPHLFLDGIPLTSISISPLGTQQSSVLVIILPFLFGQH